MQRLWSLYNKYEKLRIDDLRSDQVRTILLAIPASRMKDWYACKEGDLHWHSIAEIEEFYEDVHAIKGQSLPDLKVAAGAEPAVGAARPVESRRPLFEEAPSDFVTNPQLLVERTAAMERRSARRYARAMQFTVKVGGKEHVMETKDISMGGLALTAPLPDGLGKTFRGKLAHGKVSVRILCAKVSETKVKFLEAESWDVIRHWLVNW